MRCLPPPEKFASIPGELVAGAALGGATGGLIQYLRGRNKDEEDRPSVLGGVLGGAVAGGGIGWAVGEKAKTDAHIKSDRNNERSETQKQQAEEARQADLRNRREQVEIKNDSAAVHHSRVGDLWADMRSANERAPLDQLRKAKPHDFSGTPVADEILWKVNHELKPEFANERRDEFHKENPAIYKQQDKIHDALSSNNVIGKTRYGGPIWGVVTPQGGQKEMNSILNRYIYEPLQTHAFNEAGRFRDQSGPGHGYMNDGGGVIIPYQPGRAGHW